MNSVDTWEGLRDHFRALNSRVPTYVGDTKEEYEALVAVGDMGMLWGTQCHGPCEGGAIGPMVRLEAASGALPFYHPSDSGYSMGDEAEDKELICCEHNKSMVRLYLRMKHQTNESE